MYIINNWSIEDSIKVSWHCTVQYSGKCEILLCTMLYIGNIVYNTLVCTDVLSTHKRPLDSYACPDQIKGNRTDNSINVFTWKKYSCNFMGKSKMRVHSFSFLA